MSKPELGIVRSPEAQIFLRMVTEGFYDQSFTGLWMFEVVGREWDEMREWAEGLKSEVHPQTCTWSIAIWEWVYGFEPDESLSLEERRRRILSKVIGTRPINPEVLRRGIAALAGSDAQVELKALVSAYRFKVTIRPGKEEPLYQQILQYIGDVKPAHLAVEIIEEVTRAFREVVAVNFAGTVAAKLSAGPVGENRVSADSVLISSGAVLTSGYKTKPKDIKRGNTVCSTCTGGAYSYTRIRSKLVN